jgi:hypothetical protein
MVSFVLSLVVFIVADTCHLSVSDNLGKRNQTVAAQWHQLDPATQKLYKSKSFLDSLKTQDGLDLPMRTGRTPSTKNLFTSAEVWAKDVSGKVCLFQLSNL